MYGIQQTDGGIVPREDITTVTPELAAHFNQYGETIVRIQNTGTNDEPVWEESSQCFEETYAAKYAEIISGANAVKQALSSKYSAIEEQTWPQQEAGARAILGLEAECKDETASTILKDTERTALAVNLVEQLAAAGNTSKEEFAQRIITNADTAYNAGIQTLLEQQGYEATLKQAKKVEDVQAIAVVYSVLLNAETGE